MSKQTKKQAEQESELCKAVDIATLQVIKFKQQSDYWRSRALAAERLIDVTKKHYTLFGDDQKLYDEHRRIKNNEPK